MIIQKLGKDKLHIQRITKDSFFPKKKLIQNKFLTKLEGGKLSRW